MPRFVLLYHDCPPGYVRPSHWDLMLESGEVLETWALAQLPRGWQAAHAQTTLASPNCPSLSESDTVVAEHLAGHRLAYLNYEGVVSGGRGEVVRVAAGTFHLMKQSDDNWLLSFTAGTIQGTLLLERESAAVPTWQIRASS
jgi:hypothetical protein